MLCPSTGEKTCKCKEHLRKLFSDHAVYEKFSINAIVDKTNDKDAIVNAMKMNADMIGAFVAKKLKNEDAGMEMAQLLREHIKLAGEAVKSKTLIQAEEKFFENASKVAVHISNLNPDKLPYEVVLTEFRMICEIILKMANLRIQMRYSEELEKYDQYYMQMIGISDMLYEGITDKK